MIFKSVTFDETNVVTVTAEGHANEVVEAFHHLAGLLLSSLGPWRITDVKGSIKDSTVRDSEMEWTLKAKLKI